MFARRLAAGVAALAIVAIGALTASAAPLGVLTSQAPTTACDGDGIALAYTTAYDATSNDYQVAAVIMSGVNAACSGRAFHLVLSDGVAVLGEKTGTVALVAGSQTVTLTTPVSARAVTQASLVITG